MASLDSTITIELCEPDRELIKKFVSLLETLNERDDFKAMAKEVMDQHSRSGGNDKNCEY